MTSRSSAPCVHCGGGDDEGLVLLCELCDGAAHAHCVGFRGALEGDWLCSACTPPAAPPDPTAPLPPPPPAA